MAKCGSIGKIFNEMDSEEETDYLSKNVKESFSREYYEAHCVNRAFLKNLKRIKEPKSFEEAFKSANEAKEKWQKADLEFRADVLHVICYSLKTTLKSLPFLKDELSLFIEYFDFYCNVLLHMDIIKVYESHSISAIILSNHSIFFPVAAAVSGALAAGCSVILIAPETTQTFFLMLQEIFSQASLPDGVFNLVVENDKTSSSLLKNVNKIFFCGPFLSAQELYKNTLFESFNFVCPNNTAAFILESADFDSAVDKIVFETWSKDEPFFAVSTLVIQESVCKEVSQKLEFKIHQFMLKTKQMKFMNEAICQKIQNLITKATLAGASVHEFKGKNLRWGPTIIVNYQDQDIDQDVPVLKLLLCRTAKEGVTLLNNCRYTLGTSVWSEIPSQALEISSKLITPNIWVNCHGIFAAGVPFQVSGFSGNCVLGGGDGLLEYVSYKSPQTFKSNEGVQETIYKSYDWKKTSGIAELAYIGFTAWKSHKEKRNYLKKIADSFTEENEGFGEIIKHFAHSQCITSMSDTLSSEEFLYVKKGIPKGVILLLLNAREIDETAFISFITPAITFGNAVIIVIKEENLIIESFIQSFTKILPPNVISLIVGMESGIPLVSHPYVQEVWLYNEFTTSPEFLQSVKTHSVRNLKKLCILPQKIHSYKIFFQKEFSQNKVLWLPQIDEFP